MEVITTFAIGRLLYGFVGRVRIRFVIFELISVLVFFVLGLRLLDYPNIEVRSLLMGFLFLGTGLLTHIIAPQVQVERGSTQNVPEKGDPRIHIIDFVWLSIMGGMLTILIFARSLPPFVGDLPENNASMAQLQESLAVCQFLLGKVIDFVPVLGGILAGCMAIIWAGEIWRKDKSEDRRYYFGTTVASIKMVIAFFVVIIAVLLWLGIPLYRKMILLTGLIR